MQTSSKPCFIHTLGNGELDEVAYFRKARNRYVCHECQRMIPVGERYIEDRLNRVRHYRDGRSFTVWMLNRICQDCWKAPFGAIRVSTISP